MFASIIYFPYNLYATFIKNLKTIHHEKSYIPSVYLYPWPRITVIRNRGQTFHPTHCFNHNEFVRYALPY